MFFVQYHVLFQLRAFVKNRILLQIRAFWLRFLVR